MRRSGLMAMVTAAVALCVMTAPAGAETERFLAGSGDGTFPEGSSFNGVAVTGMRFGVGVDIPETSLASGTLQFTLLGTTQQATTQLIRIEIHIGSASVDAQGVVTASGPGAVDMGDGSPSSNGVPSALTFVPDTTGLGTMALVVGGTNLPPAAIAHGGVTVLACVPPAEAAVDALVLLDQQTLSWSPSPEALSYSVYRGSIPVGAWVFDHACLEPSTSSPYASDSTLPELGRGIYYLVSGRNECGEGSLGWTSSGQERPNLAACP